MKKNKFVKSVIILSVFFSLLMHSCDSSAKTSFKDIVATDAAAYDNYQMKFTFMGIQIAPITSVVFGSAPTDMSAFTPYRRSDVDYENDDLPFASFTASGSEIEKMIKAIEVDAIYTDNSDKTEPLYSFMIMRDTGKAAEKVFETLVLPADGPRLLEDFILPNLDPGNAHGKELCTFFFKNVGG